MSIYLLSNPSLKYVKIGYTSRNAQKRVEELDTTGVPTPFKIEHVWNGSMNDEKRIHRELRRYRVSNRREFFNLSVSHAIYLINEIFGIKNEGHNHLHNAIEKDWSYEMAMVQSEEDYYNLLDRIENECFEAARRDVDYEKAFRN